MYFGKTKEMSALSIDEKVSRLKKLGISVSIVHNKKDTTGSYILGKMKDMYPDFRIM